MAKKKKKKVKKRDPNSPYKGKGRGSNPGSKKGHANMSKPGMTNNPGGKKPGTISLTRIIKRMLAASSDKDENRTVGEELMDVALKKAKAGDFKFWNAMIERNDGKIPDHLVLQKAEVMVQKEVVAIAGAITEIVVELANKHIEDPEVRSTLINELGEQLIEHFADDDEEEEGE